MRPCDEPLALARNATREADVIEEGKPAPNFELQSDSGETIELAALRGRPVVLYFYPKDDTPASI